MSPFSLTPDPRFYFRSRSHGRVFDLLSSALVRRETLLLVAGDLGVGKTTLCRTLIDLQHRKSRAALVGNALLSPNDLIRLLLQDLGALSADEITQGSTIACDRAQLLERFDRFIGELRTSGDGAVVIVDEAHSLPPSTTDQLLELATLPSNRDRAVQFLLAAQPAVGNGPVLPALVDQRVNVRARLLPLERDECANYVAHRLAVAGELGVVFSAESIGVIYRLSGGVPRLVNLLCERAMQQADQARTRRVEAAMIDTAASALDLIRLRPRRFRWFGRTGGTAGALVNG